MARDPRGGGSRGGAGLGGPGGRDSAPERGIPDGLLVGILLFLIGVTLLVWSATGLAALLAHGAWPENVSFIRTPRALRHLIGRPDDLPAAWPETPAEQLSGYGLFWGILISQLMVLTVLTVFAIGTVARYRMVRARRHAERSGEPLPAEYQPKEQAGPRREATARAAEAHTAQAQPPQPAPQPRGAHEPPAAAWAPPAATPPMTAPPMTAPPTTAQQMTAAQAAEAPPTPGVNGGSPASHAASASAPVPGLAPTPAPAPAAGTPGGRPSSPMDPAVTTGTTQTSTSAVSPPAPPAPAFSVGHQSGVVPAPGTTAFPSPQASLPRIVYGVQRGDEAVRTVLEADGPVLVVTSDPGLWAATKDARAKLGPVHTFDPSHLLDTPMRVRWNPATGCETRDTAAARAAALLAPVRPGHALDRPTADAAETLLRCWLHAAAVDSKPFRQVHRWAQGNAAHEPVRILRTHPKAAGGAAGELEATLTAHPERRDMALELTARALSALSSIHIRDACNPGRADALAVESFIAEGGTLYLVGESLEDPRTHPGAMPLLTALASSVVEHGRRMAERSSSGRLDPPMTLVLDDIAAVAPIPALPDLVTHGAAQGLLTLALMRSQEQARTRWPNRTLAH